MRSPTRPRGGSSAGSSTRQARQRGARPAGRSGRRVSSLSRAATAVRSVLVGGVVERHEDLLEGALAQDEDQAGKPFADRDEVDAAQVRGLRAWPASRGRRRGSATASVVAARRNQCSLAYSTWPNWWRIISCSTAGSGTVSTIDST